jgi:hypothetical protein
MSEAIHERYRVIPILSENRFLQEVTYVQDVAEVWRQHTTDDGQTFSGRDPRLLACYKDTRWSFQAEHRFTLMITGRVPDADPREISVPPTPGIGYIDIPLSDRAIEQMDITLGPLSTHEDAIIVGALLETYAPGVSMAQSALRGVVRGR